MKCSQGFRRRALAAVMAAIWCGCGGAEETAPPPEETIFKLTTDPMSVPAGAERYMCYAQTLDRDLVVDRFSYAQTATVHHLLLAKTTTPEPDGVAECDVLFRTSWIPLFGAGNGTVDLDAPAGSGHVLPKGTQLLVQLHLLNSDQKGANTSVTVEMREVVKGEVSPIGLYAFGTNDIKVPASQAGSASNDCVVEKDVEIFAWYPHMHRFGTSLSLSIGADEGSLKEVYRVAPWDFDNQKMDAMTLSIPAGSMWRVRAGAELHLGSGGRGSRDVHPDRRVQGHRGLRGRLGDVLRAEGGGRAAQHLHPRGVSPGGLHPSVSGGSQTRMRLSSI